MRFQTKLRLTVCLATTDIGTKILLYSEFKLLLLFASNRSKLCLSSISRVRRTTPFVVFTRFNHFSAHHFNSECFDRFRMMSSAFRSRLRTALSWPWNLLGMGSSDGGIGKWSNGLPINVDETRFSPPKPHHTNAVGHCIVITWMIVLNCKMRSWWWGHIK